LLTRNLGNTGLEVSEIGFGAWGIGGPADGSPAYGPTDDAESKLALRTAYDLGITFYDTSDLYGYGRSERLIGETFADVREKIVIATKVGLLDINDTADFSPSHIRSSLEGSLNRLRTDYVDLYQLHSPPIELLEQDDVLSTLEALQREGKIRAYAISLRSPEDGVAAITQMGFKCIQVNFNLVDQRALTSGLFDLCREKNVGVIVRTPLCFGFLTGVHDTSSTFDEGDHRSRWSSGQIERWVDSLELFTAAMNQGGEPVQVVQTPAQLSLRYCLSYPSVSTVIPGMLLKSEVTENAAASGMKSLSSEELAQIEQVYRDNTFFVRESASLRCAQCQN